MTIFLPHLGILTPQKILEAQDSLSLLSQIVQEDVSSLFKTPLKDNSLSLEANQKLLEQYTTLTDPEEQRAFFSRVYKECMPLITPYLQQISSELIKETSTMPSEKKVEAKHVMKQLHYIYQYVSQAPPRKRSLWTPSSEPLVPDNRQF